MKSKMLWSYFLFTIAALLPSCFAFASADTLFISGEGTIYLLFEQEVVLVDIGKADHYQAKIEGKCVFIKALKEKSATTSLLIQYGEGYFAATLTYKPIIQKFLYDYRKKDLLETAVQEGSDERKIDKQKVKQHFTAFQKLPQGVKRKTVGRHHLQLSLTHLQNDKWATYLSFTLQNGSSIDYEIDMVTFERKQKRGKRFSENNISHQFVEPVFASDTKLIGAQKKEALQYAIPLYALGAKSHLKLSLREKSGSRLLTLKLPARYINKAFIYQR